MTNFPAEQGLLRQHATHLVYKLLDLEEGAQLSEWYHGFLSP